MIPHRMPSNEFFGHELKTRVTACRKRLRVNRNLHKVQCSGQTLAIVPEEGASFPDDYPGVRESISGGLEATELREREARLRLEQEVRIT